MVLVHTRWIRGPPLARKRTPTASWARASGAALALAVARGTALFLGLYLLANSLAGAVGSRMSQDLWLIDASFLPRPAGTLLTVAAALLLVAYGVAPTLSKHQNALVAAACAALAVVALRNVVDFYRAWGAHTFTPHVPFPLSLAVVALFTLLGWAASSIDVPRIGGAQHLAAAVALVVVAALFPLAQIGFFGTSDYRTEADAAVVFGARANRGGSLSTSLADRVSTAVDLYRSGLVRTLVMSGGVSDSQVDEPDAMRAAAERAGVPTSAILLDENGADTEATVANTTALFERDGIRRVLAVSQGYHLPRVKLAYMAAGVDVRTVPAKTSIPIPQTPLYMLREVPAFWQYWARSALGV